MRKAKIRHNNINRPEIATDKLFPIPIIAASKKIQAINRLFCSERRYFRFIS